MDLLLLLMILIWGANFSIVKVALRDFPEVGFNATRLFVAMAVYLAIIFATPMRATVKSLTRREWIELAFLGSVGTFLY
ncbi:MAG TPA: EamA family transporter, partial [Vicinamibacterales bacterium]|nr:EamA family transporter [Vicinamibacterales bacterium]